MFGNEYISNINQGIDLIKNASSDSEFEGAVASICDYMQRRNWEPDQWKNLDKLSYHQKNEYSDVANNEAVSAAKSRVISYLEELIEGTKPSNEIIGILERFYYFIESINEKTPHAKSTLRKEILEQIQIKNEYDLQFLLYAYLKPIYRNIRSEVSEDAGYRSVRTDLCLDDETVIEIKCTRESLSESKLVEEVSADIINYNEKNIYFFIYDKEKVIKNKEAFKSNYEKKTKEKNIHIIIYQSIYL